MYTKEWMKGQVASVLKSFDNSDDVEKALKIVIAGIYTAGFEEGVRKGVAIGMKEIEKNAGKQEQAA